jgi:hypothetical protein
MSSDGGASAAGDPCGGVVSFSYNACASGDNRQVVGQGPTIALVGGTGAPAANGKGGGLTPAGERVASRGITEHSFEFRLSGSERQEQSWPRVVAAAPIVAIRRVRAYLTRQGEPAEAMSAIGGVEVHAELRGTDILCTAQLSDFGPGDLVVVQVEVGVFDLGK